MLLTFCLYAEPPEVEKNDVDRIRLDTERLRLYSLDFELIWSLYDGPEGSAKNYRWSALLDNKDISEADFFLFFNDHDRYERALLFEESLRMERIMTSVGVIAVILGGGIASGLCVVGAIADRQVSNLSGYFLGLVASMGIGIGGGVALSIHLGDIAPGTKLFSREVAEQKFNQ